MKRKVLFMLAVLGICAINANAALSHRYDFTTDASDSVGSADGTLGSGTIADGKVTTDGSTTGVSLPATAVSGITGSFTIETWFLASAPQGDFHTLFSLDDGTTDNFIIAVPVRNGGDNYDSSIHVRQAEVTDSLMRGTPLDVWPDNPDQGPRQMLVTYDGTTLTYYENGVVAPYANNFEAIGLNLETLATQIDINSGAPFPDPSLIGSTYDFRIYDQSLTADQVAAIYALGADADNVDISAAAVPEPATMIMLGLGSLVALRKRRV